jgi:hypothetical protein
MYLKKDFNKNIENSRFIYASLYIFVITLLFISLSFFLGFDQMKPIRN